MPVNIISKAKPAAPKPLAIKPVAALLAPKAPQAPSLLPKAPAKAAKPVSGPFQKTVTKTVAPPVVESKVSQQAEGLENFELSLEDLVEKFGELSDKADALSLNPVYIQLKMAREELVLRLQEFKPEDAVTIKGKNWMVEAGVCSKAPRQITDVPQVMTLLGKETFLKLAKISVGDAEKYLTPEQLAKVVSDEKLTNNRKIAYTYIGS